MMDWKGTRKAALTCGPRAEWFGAVLTMLGLAAWSSAPLADAKNSTEWHQLAAMLDKTLQAGGVVGGSVAVVENGRLLAQKNYGFADRNGGRRVSDDTVFHWASITCNPATGRGVIGAFNTASRVDGDSRRDYFSVLRGQALKILRQ